MANIEDVIKNGLCTGCGLCAYSDNIQKTVYSKTRKQYVPSLKRENKNDLFAYNICPGKGYSIISMGESLYPSSTYDIELGHVYQQYAAFSNDTEILKYASSGGIMSQLAIYLLESKMVDRVLTTRFSYSPEPRAISFLSGTRDEILQSQGSKYCPADLSAAIREIKSHNYKVAVIGTPCQIAGIRNIQRLDPSFRDKIFLTIANFCGGIKAYNNISVIARRKGINPTAISEFRFRGNGQPGSMFIKEENGKSVELPYPRYVGLNGIPKHYRCHLCVDATGELADIACGDAWLPRFLNDQHPWSVVITRNQLADDIFKAMKASDLITTQYISRQEVKKSQVQNLTSKKVRQKSRYFLYKYLGFKLPYFDGGYYNNELKVWTEIKVFTKHHFKHLLEKLGLFYPVYKMLKK